MKKFLTAFFIFFSCVFFICARAETVLEVIDGDTVRLENGRLLRYIGIDTPETRVKKGRVWIDSPQPFSKEAKAFNRMLVEGKSVRVEFDVDTTDIYGRLLGYVFLQDRCVNTMLLEEGLAVLYTCPPNVKYTNIFVAAQNRARKRSKGLWGSYGAVTSDEAHKYVGQIKSIRGLVRGTYQSGKSVFLNFGSNWRTDFTVVIFNDSLPLFSKKGIKPVTFYQGKYIEVTGRVREYNGPEIIVNIPEEIRVLKK